MILDFNDISVGRVIIHRVHKKSDEGEHGYPEYSDNLFLLDEDEKQTLLTRISAAFGKQRRFFRLNIARTENDSFYGNASKIKGCPDDEFINNSKNIADLLAQSHDKRTIPSGLLLVLDGVSKGKHFVLVIKAELQEAFTINEERGKKVIELIDDLFLSPAKDFYKIGYIVEDTNAESGPNRDYSCYMYDDNFSSGKRDLAEYFYEKFLGFTTNKNDKLLTKNFLSDMFRFIDSNVEGFDDKRGLKNALNSLYREDITGVINPKEFADQNLEGELLRLYGTEVGQHYPTSFTKDLSLVDNRLKRGQIRLKRDLKIEGPSEAIEHNVSVQAADSIDFERLRLSIENGEIEQLITVKTSSSVDSET